MSDGPAEPSTVPPAGPVPAGAVPPAGPVPAGAAPPAGPVPAGAAPPAGPPGYGPRQPGAPDAWPTPPGDGDREPRQRLHPLSPALHGAKSLVVVIAGLSWSTLSRVGFGWFAAMVAVLALGATVLSVVSWYNTGYHVVGRELRVYEGLLWRRTRAIPLERLQAVEVVRPLLAQLTGLAELRLEVVGGGKTEAPLAYLGVADATALRERLLVLAGRVTQTPTPDHEVPPGTATTPTAPPGRALHTVRNRTLLISQLLTPQAFLLPFGVAFVVAQFLSEGSWSFVAVASTLTAMAGVLLQPIRRVLDDWNFRLARSGGTLRVHNGLLETRAQTVPLERVQTVRATWPLLWRVNGWLRLRLEVAGYSVAEADERNSPDRLLPVGDLPTATMIVAEVLPGVRLDALTLSPPPPRTRWLHPLGRSAFGAGLFEQVFATRSGRLTRQLVIVPYARIQSVRVVQGPIQRRLGLASVHADTAGGSGATAQDRDLAEAWALAAELTTRAHQAQTPNPR
ncbi:PH domain-containing protein [Micromonospora sp. WMMD1120]|uniref:PH domain-containing protein n=1 Tax=Micromonospora sp. WMMD1120 TaxID=3016106 RepID=UPI0024161876|nr:PH domain-containing protein [Micromonospora sp. WMMD1120]MDG4811293.1 PH domain-containing protein [Micromonospora sp. WMMD1120]